VVHRFRKKAMLHVIYLFPTSQSMPQSLPRSGSRIRPAGRHGQRDSSWPRACDGRGASVQSQTCPINKQAMNRAGYPFSGIGTAGSILPDRNHVAMMFVGTKVECGFSDDPISLCGRSQGGSQKTASLPRFGSLNQGMKRYFGLFHPDCSPRAHPHSGEEGLWRGGGKGNCAGHRRSKVPFIQAEGPFPGIPSLSLRPTRL